MVSSPPRKFQKKNNNKKSTKNNNNNTEIQVHHVTQYLQSHPEIFKNQKDYALYNNINEKSFSGWTRCHKDNVQAMLKQSKESKDTREAALDLLDLYKIIKDGASICDEETNDVCQVNLDILERFVSSCKDLKHEFNIVRQCPPVVVPPPSEFNLQESAEKNKKHWSEDVTNISGCDQPATCCLSTACSQTRKLLRKDMDKISGGIPESHCKMDDHHLFRGWNDGTYQLVYWPVPATKSDNNKTYIWNCAIIDSSVPCDVEANKIISRFYADEFLKSPAHRRGGGAGGPVQVHTAANNNCNTGAISKQTTLNRKFSLSKNGFAKNPKFSYQHPTTGTTVHRDGTAMDVHGNQFKRDQKLARMKKSQVFRRRAIDIQKSRFRSLLIATGCQLPVAPSGSGVLPKSLANDNEEGLWKHLNDAIPMCHQHKKYWKSHDPTLSEFDILMMYCGIQTGEIVNHQQLHCHYDTSKGHTVETLELIAMAAAADPQNCNGQIFVPLQNHGYDLRPGRDLLHANFTLTMHVPDESRGVTNMSKADHGDPKKKDS